MRREIRVFISWAASWLGGRLAKHVMEDHGSGLDGHLLLVSLHVSF